MSKAYCCDNCFECHRGDPEIITEHGKELCPNCVRVLKVLLKIDPFDFPSSKKKRGETVGELL